jgi:hypothetical protein
MRHHDKRERLAGQRRGFKGGKVNGQGAHPGSGNTSSPDKRQNSRAAVQSGPDLF